VLLLEHPQGILPAKTPKHFAQLKACNVIIAFMWCIFSRIVDAISHFVVLIGVILHCTAPTELIFQPTYSIIIQLQLSSLSSQKIYQNPQTSLFNLVFFWELDQPVVQPPPLAPAFRSVNFLF